MFQTLFRPKQNQRAHGYCGNISLILPPGIFLFSYFYSPMPFKSPKLVSGGGEIQFQKKTTKISAQL